MSLGIPSNESMRSWDGSRAKSPERYVPTKKKAGYSKEEYPALLVQPAAMLVYLPFPESNDQVVRHDVDADQDETSDPNAN